MSDARGLAWQESDIIKGHEGQERRKGLGLAESDIIKGREEQEGRERRKGIDTKGLEGRERRKGYETVSNLMENKAL